MDGHLAGMKVAQLDANLAGLMVVQKVDLTVALKVGGLVEHLVVLSGL